MSYLVISRIEVVNANSQPVWWVVGPPSPVAYCGFAHNVARELDVIAHFQGVVPVHHHYELLADGNSPYQLAQNTLISHTDHVGKSKTKRGDMSGQPTARCNLIVSLAMKFDDKPGQRIDPDDVQEFIAKGARIAGGNIRNTPGVRMVQELSEARLRGFGLHQRLDLMSKGPLDVLQYCNLSKREEYPWLMLTTLGYRKLTDTSSTRASRDGYPHVYAEPLVAPVQYVSTREKDPQCWQYTHDSDTFTVTTTN